MQSEIMNQIPMLVNGAILQEVDSSIEGVKEAIVILPNKNQIKVVNEVGSFVLHLIDGKRSVIEIVQEVQRVYRAPLEQIARDVVTFLEQLAAKDIIILGSTQSSK